MLQVPLINPKLRERMMALSLLPSFVLMQPRMWFCTLLHCKGMLLALVNLVIHQESTVVVETELPAASSPHPVCIVL